MFKFDDTPKQKSPLRWLVLLFCCISTFGDYYCFDNVGAVHDHLKSQFDFLENKFEYYYNLLYSLYSVVNIIIPFIGGTLVKIYGNSTMFIIFSIFIVLGQFIVYIGCKNLSILTMIIGRIIFGLGGENLNVTQMAVVVDWFYKSETALPMGFTLTLSRCGSFLNDLLSPIFAGEINKNGKLEATNAFYWGLIFSICSFIFTVLLVWIIYQKDKICNLLEKNNDIIVNNHNTNNIWYLIKNLNLLFWLISIIILTSYGALMPFNYLSVGFFTQSEYKISKKKAGILMGVPFLMGAILVPILGKIIDKYAFRCLLIIISGFFCLISFILFNFIKPYIPLFFLGAGYSIFASVLWPAVPIVLNNKEISGFAYGISTSLQNISMSINPMITAWILVNYNNEYFYCMMFLCLICFFSIGFSFWLYYENLKNNKILDKVKYDDELNMEKNKNKTTEMHGVFNDKDSPNKFKELHEEI